MKPNSIKFAREASKCELAAKIAAYLEASVPANHYDFALPDLLYFREQQTLISLRKDPIWQELENVFKANGGLLSEDWEKEGKEKEEHCQCCSPVRVKLSSITKEVTYKKLSPVSNKSRIVGLGVCLVFTAAVGAVFYFMPHGSPETTNQTR